MSGTSLPQVRKLGLQPRGHDYRVPHYSSYAQLIRKLPTPPASLNNYTGMKHDTDMLGNDSWGCCAEAATYRGVEIHTFRALGTELTVPAATCLQLYGEVTGFDISAGPSGSNPTDNGTNLQALLIYRVQRGIPLANNRRTAISGFFEVDPRDIVDVQRAIWEGGAVQIGLNCYESFLNVLDGGTWLPPGRDASVVGGHAVVCGKYSIEGFYVKSWGAEFLIPVATWLDVVTECYVTVAPEWIAATGRSPLGMTPTELSAALSSLQH